MSRKQALPLILLAAFCITATNSFAAEYTGCPPAAEVDIGCDVTMSLNLAAGSCAMGTDAIDGTVRGYLTPY